MKRQPAILKFVLVLVIVTTFATGLLAQNELPRGNGAIASSSSTLSAVDDIMNGAVSRGTIPGGVVLIGHDGKVVYRKAFGMRSLEPNREAMTADTIFDLASLTKCVATATSVMRLVQEGKLRLNDPVAVYLPEFAKNGKENITLRQLLTHFSGLREDLDLKAAWTGRSSAYQMVMDEKPAFPPGSRFLYSDINFQTLGFVVEKVSGLGLNEYAARNVFEPLAMHNTRYLPPAEFRPLIAPTEYNENREMLRGTVHDPTARRMGGVAGHAGLFSTADDLAKYAQDMLTGFHVLSALTVQKMSTPQQPPTATSLRGLGWDIDSPFASNRGDFFPVGSFGHTGFTGTSLWIDPVTNSYVIILTNAVHPRGGASMVSVRARVASVVAQYVGLTSAAEGLRFARITGYNEGMSASRLVTARNASVRTGIDVLESHDFSQLREPGRAKTRVALVTNHTGVDARGGRTIDVLVKARGIEVTAIFSPEHGVTGSMDTTAISDSKDVTTGIPVYSIYGDTSAKRHPSLEIVSAADVIIYDIQDIGTRFYTYETTLGYLLEAAAKTGKRIFVLDRPNPINGAYVQGPISDKGRESFTDYGQIPVRHGMTIGELARFYNSERGINARLTVVPVEGWQRGDWLDSAGILWINPSPNMRSLTEAALYPGVGMIESTNISVGRGTDTPFELLGAPWIHPTELASYLNARAISGVRFVPVEFTPNADVYAQKKCGGVNVIVTDRNALDAPELGIEIASALHSLYPDQYDLSKLDRLMHNDSTAKAIGQGQDPRRIWMEWNDALEIFKAARAKYLLY
ncbi:MAG TPA: exo-beta-N-acetylmuramidase NamZ domain-containing protein [Candidatus Saccharimonadales bacterium]|nr:exo-beta-N-acetylmuramidase NamZ domain-containing protein [Candidatus Saccharimonadales bacterium]